jgi:SpoU rRNA methylase family enzyme
MASRLGLERTKVLDITDIISELDVQIVISIRSFGSYSHSGIPRTRKP